MSVNSPRGRVGLPPLAVPPPPPAFGIFRAKSVQARNENGKFTLAVLNAADDRELDWYIVAATQAGSPGQKPRNRDFIVIHPNAALADLASLGDAYLQTYRRKHGVPRPGQRLGVRITPFTNGVKGVPWPRDAFVTD